MTSLQLAMLNNNKDVVQELSKAFANINDVNEVRNCHKHTNHCPNEKPHKLQHVTSNNVAY